MGGENVIAFQGRSNNRNSRAMAEAIFFLAIRNARARLISLAFLGKCFFNKTVRSQPNPCNHTIVAAIFYETIFSIFAHGKADNINSPGLTARRAFKI